MALCPDSATLYAGAAGLYNDTPIGALAARVEKNEETGKETQLYIMTLGVLEPYRRCGVATQMLEYILNLVKDDAEFADLLTVVIHVQTNNDAALAMYKKHGFEITGHKENYYQVCCQSCYRLFLVVVVVLLLLLLPLRRRRCAALPLLYPMAAR